VKKVIERPKPRERAVLRMRYYEELPTEEIAERAAHCVGTGAAGEVAGTQAFPGDVRPAEANIPQRLVIHPGARTHLNTMHSRIEQEEIVERYARKQLTPKERLAFEEHFFGCDECFQKLQEMQQFLAGMRDAGERGLLNEKAAAEGLSRWFLPALAATCAALLGAASGWMYFHEIPLLRRELGQSTKQLIMEKQERAELERKAAVVEAAEANVPLVMLQTSRAGEGPATVALSKEARHLVLWIEIGPSRYREFQLKVFSEKRLVTALQHLKPGPYGALAASLPTAQLPRGECRINLTGQDPAPAAPAGEYLLKINRP